MRQKQDSNSKRIEEQKEKKRKRMTERRLLKKFKTNKNFRPLIKRIVETNWGKVDFFEEYDMMLAWCGQKNLRVITVLRYHNWIKNHAKWKAAKELPIKDLESYERRKTRELLDSRTSLSDDTKS
ncbi:MAG: hypothetical protein GY861_18185 [bacterium]|nr:hypothetical protein [bacterium]